MKIVPSSEEVYLLGSDVSDGLDGLDKFWCTSLFSVQCCNDQVGEGIPALRCREVFEQGPPDLQDTVKLLELWLDVLTRYSPVPVSKT